MKMRKRKKLPQRGKKIIKKEDNLNHEENVILLGKILPFKEKIKKSIDSLFKNISSYHSLSMSNIKTFEEFRDMIFSLQSEFEKIGKSMAPYSSMRNIIDKNKARAQYKEFFEAVEGSVRIVLEALNNELVDIL